MRGVVTTMVLLTVLMGCSSSDADVDVVSDVDEQSVVEITAAPTTAGTTPPTTDTTTVATSDVTIGATTDVTAGTSLPPVSGSPVTPSGFDLVHATVTTADGEVCELCLWLADSSRSRAQGLMGVTDLGAGDGMAFVYDAPHTGSFWMKNTLLPLSIAFFDEQGDYLDSFDMEPCEADPCPLYPTAPEFLVAIETVQGDLDGLGIADGSRLDLTTLPCG